MTLNAALADKLALKITDNREQPGWEEALWEELVWIDGLDTKQVDILFGMIVARWDRQKRMLGASSGIVAEHAGPANHFRLNLAGRTAVKAARASA